MGLKRCLHNDEESARPTHGNRKQRRKYTKKNQRKTQTSESKRQSDTPRTDGRGNTTKACDPLGRKSKRDSSFASDVKRVEQITNQTKHEQTTPVGANGIRRPKTAVGCRGTTHSRVSITGKLIQLTLNADYNLLRAFP